MQASFDSAGIYNFFFFFLIFVVKKIEYLATRLLERKTLANKLKQETGNRVASVPYGSYMWLPL